MSRHRRRALLVASTGGHLEELFQLEPRLSPEFSETEWVTFDDAQSRSLLAGRTVHHVDRIPPRGLREAVNDVGPALRILRRGRFTDVISTGSAIAVPFLYAAAALGRRPHYIESAARTMGPSLTGRLVSRVPGVALYSQLESWADRRWMWRGSVMDGFQASPLHSPPHNFSRIVVTFGTMRGFPFPRAVHAADRLLAEVGNPDREVLWQIGDTPARVSGKTIHGVIPTAELDAAMADADLVIAHGGLGSVLRTLNTGMRPLLLFRQARYGEHVDDHQRLICAELEFRGLAVARDPKNLRAEDAFETTSRTCLTNMTPPPFMLINGRRRPAHVFAQRGGVGAADACQGRSARLLRPIDLTTPLRMPTAAAGRPSAIAHHPGVGS